MEEIPKRENIVVESIDSPEKKDIMENAHFERLQIIYDSLLRIVKDRYDKLPQGVKTSASVVGNFIPPFGELKLLIEGVKGKTFGGRELSNNYRILQIVSAITSVLGKLLGAYAIAKQDEDLGAIASASYITSWVTVLITSGTETIDGLKKIINATKEKGKEKLKK